MTSRYTEGQFITDPFLDYVDDRNWDFFNTETERDAWVQDRLERHRPIPAGKPILLLADRTVQHWNNGAWVTKFERLPPLDLRPPLKDITVSPERQYGWHHRPIALQDDRYPQEIAGGGVAASDEPFTVTTGAVSDYGVVEHDNHSVLTVWNQFAATIGAAFDAQIVAIGAGGVGQDRHSVPGAGGGSGALATIPWRFRAGDILAIAPGVARSGNYAGMLTSVRVNGAPVIEAPGGQPQLLGTSWTNWIPDNTKLYGSTAGTFTPPPAPFADDIYFGVRVYASQRISGNGGSGMGRSLSRSTSFRTVASVLYSPPGGMGIRMDWWPTDRIYCYGGPGGQNTGPGNSRLDPATTDAWNIGPGAETRATLGTAEPTTYGSGGRGGGGTSALDRRGSFGANGAVIVRYATPGNTLAYQTITK